MYKRYHIETSPAVLPSTQIGKFQVIREDKCLNCGRCQSLCIYDVHKRDAADPRIMAEPVSRLCKNCFSCIQNCPQQALKMVKNKESENLGNSYWKPEMIHTIWSEAEEGKIPIYGAGYRGPFKGSGFDLIWTDMSEIVRPTRDGIHGREFIATAVDMGSKLSWIACFEKLSPANLYQTQIPMLLDTDGLRLDSKNLVTAIVKAASELRTLAFVDIRNYFDELEPYLESIALRIPFENFALMDRGPWTAVNFIEIILPQKFQVPALEQALAELRAKNPQALLSLGLTHPFPPEEIFKLLEEKRPDVLSIHADDQGMSPDRNVFIADSIRKLHLDLVKRAVRDEMTVIGKGGIAAAEHVPKLIICGADAVVVDLALLVATGCRVCKDCRVESCPAELQSLDLDLARQRIVNLACAWRDQLLEVLSAMGIRDVRRLRGEKGRAMFYDEIERESFEFIFNNGGLRR